MNSIYSPEAPAKHTGTVDQEGPNNSDSEDVDEEEEEDKEESDGYDSPPMVCQYLHQFLMCVTETKPILFLL